MREAMYYERGQAGEVRCGLCPHRCLIRAGGRGLCGIRANIEGRLYATQYGRVCSTALDPVEKKPLYHFFPGRAVWSIGGWGCNFRCDFCQNWEISQQEVATRELLPAQATELAGSAGSVGLAYTYNEPFINYEYVLDCARELRAAGLKNILVSNGFYSPEPLRELLPWVDAFNIDLKAFGADFYRKRCGGTLEPVLESIRTIAGQTHLELTTLLIPGANDAPEQLAALADWIADNCGADTPAHLSAYYPCYKAQEPPTTPESLGRARDIFRRRLYNVYVGNVENPHWRESRCASCGGLLVRRTGYRSEVSGLDAAGRCVVCGADNGFTTCELI